VQASYHTRANCDHTYGSSGSANPSKPADIKQLGWEVRATSAGIGDVIAAQASTMWFIVLHIVCFAVWLLLNMKSKGPRLSTLSPFHCGR